LDAAIEAMAADSSYTPLVRRLGCLRGISTLTGFGLAVEIGDWHRFTGSSIGAFLGLVPTEDSSGESRSQGSITKAGNTHARRLLVEAAWHHRKSYRNPGRTMQKRWQLAPAPARIRGHEGNRRLNMGWQAFQGRRKRTPSLLSPSPANLPAGPGPWRSCRTNTTSPPSRPFWSPREERSTSNLGTTRQVLIKYTILEQPAGHVRYSQTVSRSSRTARPAVTNPRISVSTARRQHADQQRQRRPRRNGPAARHPVRQPAHPCPLDKKGLHIRLHHVCKAKGIWVNPLSRHAPIGPMG
jgi:hypothetical protein